MSESQDAIEVKNLRVVNAQLEKELAELNALYRDRQNSDLAKYEIQSLGTVSEDNLFGLPENYHSRIILLTEVINHSARAYKHVQHFEGKIAIKIHNEYQYLARSLAGLYSATLNKKFDVDFNLALHDALCSSCHILNDCVDMLTSYARGIRRKLKSDYIYAVIHEADPKDAERILLLQSFERVTAESRYLRGYTRIQMYIEKINSDEFLELIKYCNELEGISQNMQAAHNKVHISFTNALNLERFKIESGEKENKLKRDFESAQAELKRDFDQKITDKAQGNSTRNVFLNGIFIFLAAFFTYHATLARMSNKNQPAPPPPHELPKKANNQRQ